MNYFDLKLTDVGFKYKIVYVNKQDEVEIGKCNDIKEAFPIMNEYIKVCLNTYPKNYSVTNEDEYIKLRNGELVFRIYNV